MFLSVVMVICMLPTSIFATNIVASGYYEGESDSTDVVWRLGSDATSPILANGEPLFIQSIPVQNTVPDDFIGVYTIEDLYNIRNDPTQNYILMEDLDLSEILWEPIGTVDDPFIGTFDGNGHTIYNMTIETAKLDLSSKYIGLFGYCTGIIKNLCVNNGMIFTENHYDYVGSIAGYANSIENCSSGCYINAKCYMGGGIAGEVIKITNCYFFGALDCELERNQSDYYELSYLGGICGYASKISKCINIGQVKGDVTTVIDAYSMAGGIAGVSRDIEECCNVGNVDFSGGGYKTHISAGGICGGSPTGSDHIENSYNIGNITVSNKAYSGAVGGILGGAYGDYSFESCYNLGTLKNESKYRHDWYIGAIAGLGDVYLKYCYKDDLYPFAGDGNVSSNVYIHANSTTINRTSFSISENFIGFDFNNVWELESYMDSPQLKVFHHILYPEKEIVNNTTYTHFGQYNGSTPNYVTDPDTGLGKNLMETVTIDGTTYNVADTCKQESLLLPTDYLGNYYYIAYNLNESNEVSEATIMSGNICTLEGYDHITNVVDTDCESIIPVDEEVTLPSGSFYVSDVTADSFPSDQLSSWVGDKVRIYFAGEQIFKIIHVVEGSGTITDYDDANLNVFIDGISYNVLPDDDLISNIKDSILYSKDYILYDNLLVYMYSDDKYLAIDINSTGKSYYVGDEIMFFVYDCTETSDDYLSWTKPEGLVIQVTDDKISLKDYIEYDDYTVCFFVADKPGVTTISFSDDITSEPVNVTLHITEDKYQSLRANNVLTYTYDSIIKTDYYNAYVNGMYVTDFTFRAASDETYTFDFTVYNTTYAPGVVEVYNADGTIEDIEIIGKFSNPSSLGSVAYGGVDMIVDIWNGDTLSFKAVSYSKETKISVDVPKDGYVIVTNSCAISPACLWANLLDFYLTGASLIDGVLKFDNGTQNVIIKSIVQYAATQHSFLEFHKKFLDECFTALAEGSIFTVFGLASDNINLLLKTFDIDLEQALINAGKGYVFSTLQDLLQKGAGPVGSVLDSVFVFVEMLDFAEQTLQLRNNIKHKIGWAVFPPVSNYEGMTQITSTDGITVKAEDEFLPETILQVYSIVDYSNETDGLELNENSNYTLYDISLIRNGQEIQPQNPVMVYIPIPDGYNASSIMVYKQNQSGEWDFVESMIYNGMIVIEVDHFCLFALVESTSASDNEHNISNVWSTDADSHWHTCSCGERHDLSAHTPTDWIIDKPATADSVGQMHKQCSVCGYLLESSEIPVVEEDDDLDWSWILLDLMRREFTITANANEGGTITNEGELTVRFDSSATYEIVPDEGYYIDTVIVDGDDIGAVSTYTFDGINSNHTIEAVFAKMEWKNPYNDVAKDDWFYDAVKYVTENDLMNGMGNDMFMPYATSERAMIVTILWRLEGMPVAENAIGFSDVHNSDWYYDAVMWASENKIVEGYGDTTFRPDTPITHEQLAAILYRYAVYKGYNTTAREVLTDNIIISDWATDAVEWANAVKLLDLFQLKEYLPREVVARCQMAYILMQFCALYVE